MRYSPGDCKCCSRCSIYSPTILWTYSETEGVGGDVGKLVNKVLVFRTHNVLVREMLESREEGRVLMRCVLVHGNLGQLAQNMGCAGILVNCCIRDVDDINAYDIGVRHMFWEWLYADSDSILVFKSELSI
ncbi:hypothetical protein UlMin_027761 [Ulmus minor]